MDLGIVLGMIAIPPKELARDSESVDMPVFQWGLTVEQFLDTVDDGGYEHDSYEKGDFLTSTMNYLGYVSTVQYEFHPERGLVAVWIFIEESAGEAYKLVCDVEQFWIGPTEWVYVVIDVFQGTQVIYVEREYYEILANR